MDRDKLAELRKKKAENKAKLHKELLDSNSSIKQAVTALHAAINNQQPINLDGLTAQLAELKDLHTYSEDIKRLEASLKESSNEKKLDDLINAVGNINNKDVVLAVNSLITKLEAKDISQSEEDYQPVRRVRKVGQRLVFDDDPLQVSVSGGGGSSIPKAVIRNGNSIAVVNPDGSNISGGGGGVGGSTEAKQDVQIGQVTGLTSVNTHTGSSELRVYEENHICAQNTTSVALGSNATFTGEWQDCLHYQEVNISVDTDKNSATNGLIIQWSADGITIADTDVFSVYANSGTNYTPNPAFRYVRVVYTNGTVAQTRFNLMTILRRGVTGGSFHRIDSTLRDDADGRLNITVPKLKTAANTYVSQTATTAGNAKMSLEEIDPSVTIFNDILTELLQKTEATQNQQVELINALRVLQQATVNPPYIDKSANQMRSQVTGTLTTVTTVTNLTNIGSYPANHLQVMNNMTAWATNVRQIIT